jgi:cytochrome c-type biogenesis protein CcmE
VEKGSVVRESDGLTVHFEVTDLAKSIPVTYKGILPDLFREGQGVVALGHLKGDGSFVAEEVLAKHDEKYMPPEVAKSLKVAAGGEAGGEARRVATVTPMAAQVKP